MNSQNETLTRKQLNRATLARQMLLERESISAVAAVERLRGMQAQEPRPPFTGLWTRLHGFRRDHLHQALHDREIVRGTLMRGTLHLMSAADYVAHRMTLQPMLTRSLGLLGTRAEGLDAEEVLSIARALLGERPRTFTELRAALAEAFPGVNDRALGFTVRMRLSLLMVPTDDRWAFPADARFGLAENWLETTISTEASPDAPRPAEDTPAPPRFLPEFDNLVLSHADRGRVLADEHRHSVLGSKNGRIPATLTITPFAALPRSNAAALAAEGEALPRLLEDDAATFDVRQNPPLSAA